MKLDPDTIRKLAKITLETKPEGLSCDEWVHLVGEYIEAKKQPSPLDPRLAQVAEHAEGCAHCEEELRMLQELLDEES